MSMSEDTKEKKLKLLGEEAENELYQESQEQMDSFNPKDFMDGDKLYFKSEHIIPILKKMTPEQIVIFEHLTGIYRQTLH
jgi:hypothetical protein